jgi:hypothetical protein
LGGNAWSFSFFIAGMARSYSIIKKRLKNKYFYSRLRLQSLIPAYL